MNPGADLMAHLAEPHSSRLMLALAVLVGAAGWIGVAWIGAQLLAMDPPRAGDDLRLLVDAAGRAAAGLPLYVTMVPGTTLQAHSAFYSYPPIVAQALIPLAGLPFLVLFVGWGVAATVGFLGAVRTLGDDNGRFVLYVAAGLPYVFPFAVALLEGNANAWFPVVFGLGILAVLRPDQRTAGIAGVALAAGAAAKLHPASVGLWWLIRWLRDGRRGSAGTVVGVGIVAGCACLLLSILAGGTGPWIDYLAFLRSSTQTTNLVDPLNVGPAAQVVLLFGGGEAAARILQVPVAIAAIAITIVAGARASDSIEGLAWAVTASLILLPVTWFHYAAALVPFAVVALTRRERASQPRRAAALVVGAMAIAAYAIFAPVTVWLAVGLVLAAVRTSRPMQGAATAGRAA